MSRRRVAALIAPMVVAALVLSGCGGGSAGGLKGAGENAVGKNDINPVPRDQLKQGGTFTWGDDDLPVNYNYYQIDGLYLPGFNELSAVMPKIFLVKPDNTVAPNPDYVTEAQLTSSKPQVITYRINPKAKWSNGRAIDWTDFKAMADALKGDKKDYQVSGITGFEDISKVEKGADAREVKVTFGTDFGDWKSLFSPLYPREAMATAKEFNTGWTDKPKITAGPFKVQSVDRTAGIVTMVPDPNWWGDKPKLDKLVFRKIDRNALADAFANKTIDYFDIGSSIDLFKRASSTPGLDIRQADVPKWNMISFNSKGVLADQKLRVALMKGIDPTAITKTMLGQMVKNPKPLGNHLFSQGTPQYRDNSGNIKYNVTEAKQELDALGWKMDGDYRKKDGKTLQLRQVIDSDNPISDRISRLNQQQFKQIGVKMTIDTVPSADYFAQYVNRGDYDITGYAYQNTPFPVSGSKPNYYLDPNNIGQNFSRIGDAKLNNLYNEAGKELDEKKRVDLANQADAELWRLGHQLPLYQYPGAVATRSSVCNFGAWGFQTDIIYQNIGYKK